VSDGFFISRFYVLDECQTQYKDDCEEQQCADDGDDFGQDVHTSNFLFRFRARAADRSTLTLLRSTARKRVGKLRSETAFCSEDILAGHQYLARRSWLQRFLRSAGPSGAGASGADGDSI
jgi:hypothetical protein